MAMTREQKNKILDIFETPVMFRNEALLMLREQELEMIQLLGREVMYPADMAKKIADAGIAKEPELLIESAYARAVLNKRRDENNEVMYQIANFYDRYPYFSQYEYEEYARIPANRKAMMDEWDFEVFCDHHAENLKLRAQGYDVRMPDDNFMTLEEAQELVRKADFISIQPCNCKTMVDQTDKPRDVCVQFRHGDNTPWDRGHHGRRITGEQAAEMLVKWNKAGLMHNGRNDTIASGFCNCDSLSCYPIRMAMKNGLRGNYPHANWTIHWDATKCVCCGNCTTLCNFHAFALGDNGKIYFDAEKCWGCTICTNSCTGGAITKTPREWTLKPLPEKEA